MRKVDIPTIAARNRVIERIIDTIATRDNFLVLGHNNPDEDCIASMIAIALLITKFSKAATIYIGQELHEHFQYLINICKFNSVTIRRGNQAPNKDIDTIVICDTPKPDMLSYNEKMRPLLSRPDIVKVEIDHHLEADSAYIGDAECSLVAEASSACELVGLIALKVDQRKDLISRFQIADLCSRNFVLAVLTGIIGDTKMGKFIKSRKERRFYEIFSNMFNDMLSKKTMKGGNFSNKDEVFRELHRLSAREEACYTYMMKRKHFSESVGYTVIGEAEMANLARRFDLDTIVSVARAVADALAEESGVMSLVVYADHPEKSTLVQFRARRSEGFRDFDLRDILEIFHIENGGGHQGAIGFRIEKEKLPNLEEYVNELVTGIETALRAARTH